MKEKTIAELYEKRYRRVEISDDINCAYLTADCDGHLLAIFPSGERAQIWLKTHGYIEESHGIYSQP